MVFLAKTYYLFSVEDISKVSKSQILRNVIFNICLKRFIHTYDYIAYKKWKNKNSNDTAIPPILLIIPISNSMHNLEINAKTRQDERGEFLTLQDRPVY